MVKHILAIIVLVSGCGYGVIEHCEKPVNGEAPINKPDPGYTTFVNPILQSRCVRCHQGKPYVTSEAGFKNSTARERVKRNQMPPVGSPEAKAITAEERKTLVDFK